MEGHYNSQRNLRCQVLMVCMPVMGGYSASRRLSGLRVSSLGHQVSLIKSTLSRSGEAIYSTRLGRRGTLVG